jgi:class 3 adenylate cyclase
VCLIGDTARIGAELARFRGSVLETADGSALAGFDGPARAIRCAASLVRSGALRAGVHTGECEVATAGLRGAPVELARSIAARATPGEVLVSSTVRDLVAGSGLSFAERGTIPLETRDWELLAVI